MSITTIVHHPKIQPTLDEIQKVVGDTTIPKASRILFVLELQTVLQIFADELAHRTPEVET